MNLQSNNNNTNHLTQSTPMQQLTQSQFNGQLLSAKTPNENGTTTTIISSHKIARDSLIHKNDIFQFDDVDSVHTNDGLYFKGTPQSSFESDCTYKSNSISKSSNNRKNSSSNKNRTNKKLSNAKQSLANFITPIFRGVTSQNGHTVSTSKASQELKKPLRPQSVSSFSANISPAKSKKM